jgi:putative aldouronate transport system substrate-binding protein
LSTEHQPRKVTGTGVSRRHFLAVSTLSTIGAGLLTSCASEGSTGGNSSNDGGAAGDVLPSFIAADYVTPDYPSVNGSTAVYLTAPEEYVQSVPTPPGSGSTINAMLPIYSAVPPGLPDNKYFTAMNEMLGSEVVLNAVEGGSYSEKLQAVLASPDDVPDWVVVPSGNIPARFDEAVEALFADLTPYLAGDAIADYPNLANITTDTWKYCVYNGKLMGLPNPQESIGSWLFYRIDVLEEAGVAPPTNAEELMAFAKELTDERAGRWGLDNIFTGGIDNMFRVPLRWRLDDGALVHRYETDEYKEALLFQQELFASGVVHPDAVANTGSYKTRFEAAQVVAMVDSFGGWRGSMRRVAPQIPGYDQRPALPFAHDGGTPFIPRPDAVNMTSFIKKGDEAKVQEILGLANALAAPFGTDEFRLVNYGVEGEHWEAEADGTESTTALGSKEVVATYKFLTAPNVVEALVSDDTISELTHEFMEAAIPNLVEDPFWGRRIIEPSRFASLQQPMRDLEADVARGRGDAAAIDAAVDAWRSSGGDDLRDFYTELLD